MPSGLSGALLGALTQNYYPTMGHLIKAEIDKAFKICNHIKSPCCNWSLGDLTHSVCPTVGHLTLGYVKSPL